MNNKMNGCTDQKIQSGTYKVVNKRGQVRPTKYNTKYSEHVHRTLKIVSDETAAAAVDDKNASASTEPNTSNDLKRGRYELGIENIQDAVSTCTECLENTSTTRTDDKKVSQEDYFEANNSQLHVHEFDNEIIANVQQRSNCYKDDISENMSSQTEVDHDNKITADQENDIFDADSRVNPSVLEEDILIEKTFPTNVPSDKWNKSTLVADLLSELKFQNEEWYINDIDFEKAEDDYEMDDNSFIETEEPIQPGHTLTTSTSILLIWMFIISHSLTATQVSDLLSLINIHLVISNRALKSLHHFKKFFSQMKTPMIKHYFCNFCLGGVQQDTKICPNKHCAKDVSVKKGKDFFIELEVSKQLENLFTNDNFRSNLTHRSTRIKKNPNNIEDIYDGLLYKRFTDNEGILHPRKVNNVSFTLNTDGVPIFKSSKTSIWPIFLMINELPFRMRKQRENMLLCGLWFGQEKPVMNMFFEPLQRSLEALKDGIDIQISSDKVVTVKGCLLCLSCDIPARSAVLNMNQHNGESSCPKCLQTGVNTRTISGGNIRTFPYSTENPTGPIRTSALVVKDGIMANEIQNTINGYKGISFLMFTPNFDMVVGTGIDYMHMLCLGIVRLLLKLWFSTEFTCEEFSLHSFVEVVDSRIEQIKPSHFITRTPRTISEHMKFWKASEVRSWFFYYSVPCIMDLLKPVYFYHYCALLEGIYLLCQSSISEENIQRSEQMLNYFVFMFSSLYGERYVTLNMHSLLHLPQTVRELGPLWCYSCFAFEGANGDLIKMFHGTMYIDLQIVNAVHVFQMIPLLSKKVEENSLVSSLVKSLTTQCKSYDPSIYSFCGKSYSKQLSPLIKTEICKYLKSAIYYISLYNRAIIRGIKYHSLDYARVSMRNSYTVKYLDHNKKVSYGFVMFFASHTAINGDIENFVCISKLNPLQLNIFQVHHDWESSDHHTQSNFLNIVLPFMHIVTNSELVDIIPLINILDLCICIDGEKFKVVCEEPNHHELNL